MEKNALLGTFGRIEGKYILLSESLKELVQQSSHILSPIPIYMC